MGEWIHNSTHSLPWHWVKISSQLHAPVALPPEKEPLVPIP